MKTGNKHYEVWQITRDINEAYGVRDKIRTAESVHLADDGYAVVIKFNKDAETFASRDQAEILTYMIRDVIERQKKQKKSLKTQPKPRCKVKLTKKEIATIEACLSRASDIVSFVFEDDWSNPETVCGISFDFHRTDDTCRFANETCDKIFTALRGALGRALSAKGKGGKR